MAFGKLKVDELVTSTQTVSVDALVNVAADGDKGDITVSGTGTVWTIDAGVVDTSNLGGDITIAGKALLDDVDAAAQRTTLGAEAAGTAASAISTHEAAADPHPGYALESSLATVATTGALGDLGDVDLTTTPPANGEALVYDSVAGEWVPGAAGATAAGSANEIQYNDGASGLAASADLTWDNTGKVLGVGGDIDLDDGGTYTTTLQTITPTANRTISFPDATGTVALVAGSSGQLVYNNAGAYAGASGSSVGASGDITLSANGAASTGTGSAFKLTGSWYTGANPVPQALIQPAGTATSTTWSTSGTGLGVNAASGFTGNLLDLQVNGTSRFALDANGTLTFGAFPNPTLSFANNSTVRVGSIPSFLFGVARITLAGNSRLVWTTTDNNPSTTEDLALHKDAANTLAQRNSTNAQAYRLYNTYTDANNYQRTSITDDSTGLVIDQQYAGTGAARTNLLDLKDNGTSKVVHRDGLHYMVGSVVPRVYIGSNTTTTVTHGGSIEFGASTNLGAGVGVTLTGRRNGEFTISSVSTTPGTGINIADSNTTPVGFFGASPVAQPTTAVGSAAIAGGGGTAVDDATTFGGYTLAQVVQALQNLGILA